MATPAGLDNRALLGWLLLVPAFLPLLYVPGFLYPSMAPKTFVFRSLAILVLAMVAWLAMARVPLHYGRLKQRITWIPAVLLAVAYVTSLAGIGFHLSFWSTFERGDGLLTLTAETVLFYAMLLLAEAGFLRKLAVISMWVGSLVALLALYQWLPAHERVGSTFGNAAFMASYLGMTFFLTLWVARDLQSWSRGAARLGAGLQMVAIVVFSSTRGTIMALLCAAVVAAAFAAWKGKGRLRLLARVSLAVLFALVAVFLLFRSQLAQVSFSPIQRIAMMSPSSDTGAVRVLLWRRIGHEALAHPFVGVGAEHISEVYDSIYRPFKAAEWVDRSHNAYLDYFVQYGVTGALLYLGLVLVALRTAYAHVMEKHAAGGCMFLLFLTYAIQNVFVFDTSLTFWLFLAVFAGGLALPASAPRALALPAFPVAVRWVVCGAMIALLVPVTALPARANLLLSEAYTSAVTSVNRAEAALVKGFSMGTCADLEYGYYAYDMYKSQQTAPLGSAAGLLAYRTTLDILTQDFARYPRSARIAGYLAHVIDLTPPGLSPDVGLRDRAIERSVLLSPGHVEPWYFRANVEIRRGDASPDEVQRSLHYGKAIDTLRRYIEMVPERADPRYVIAGLYRTMGNMEQAGAWANAGDLALERQPDEFAALKAGKYYITVADWQKATRFLEYVVRTNASDHESAFLLAKAKFMAGDRAGARAVISRLRAESPATLATDPASAAKIEAE